MPKFGANATTGLLLVAYALLSMFIVMRLFIKKRTRSTNFRSLLMITLIVACSVELIWILVDDHRSQTTIVSIFNVLLILFFVRSIREVWLQFMQVVVASVPVFAIILAYFIIFTIIGFIMFANNETDNSFNTIMDSAMTVFVLFTVSNYPGVQTPYFEKNRLSMLYFWIFLLIGIFLLSNLLLAQIFLNYKKLIKKRLTKYEHDVEDYFRELFDKIDEEKQGFITVEQFVEALGGKEIVESEDRLKDLMWQAKLILDGKIQFTDFSYVMQFTDSVERQKVQLDRLRRFIKVKEKREESRKKKLVEQELSRFERQKTLGLTEENSEKLTPEMEAELKAKADAELDLAIQEEEDNAMIQELKKQNKVVCFCFKKKIKKDLEQRLDNQIAKSKKFEALLKLHEIDVTRIRDAGKQTVVSDEFGKIYVEKDHHGPWRKKFIRYQNKVWAEVPLTILSILSLFCIPVFQYCADLKEAS